MPANCLCQLMLPNGDLAYISMGDGPIHKIVFNNDNQGVTEILSSQSSKCSQIMIILCFIVLSSLKHIFLFRALHVPGISIVYCDQLSRGRIKEFKEGCPHARQASDNIPPSVWQI